MTRVHALSAFVILAAIAAQALSTSAWAGEAKFRAETLDANLQIGYGLAIGDVDGDGKDDILLADKTQFVWYQNGDWQRHVMVDGLTERDNVCLAARDLDGDGKVEVAVGAQWNPGETTDAGKSGSVHYLLRPEDPKSRWTPIQLPHEPTVHRMHWARSGDKNYLVVLPLHGRGNKDGEGLGVRILAYEMPADPTKQWKTTLLDDSMHMTHNFDLRAAGAAGDTILVGGKEGLRFLLPGGGLWQADSLPIADSRGAGEVRFASGAKFQMAAIEPMHGNEVVAYAEQKDKGVFERRVLDNRLNQGHALACADLLDLGDMQIVAGWRDKDAEGKVGIRLYVPQDASGREWKTHAIDDNTMACEDLKVADLDGDGKLDIIAAGRATKNLVVYWNETEK